MLRTERLILRQWRPEDREPFAALNADPEVMRYFPAPLSRAESDAVADRVERAIDERGWGFWAAERRDTGAFIGFVGLGVPPASLPFSPCVEVGWRLARAHCGFGFATEAARESLRFGFETLELEEIVALVVPANRRSRAVMERLGMAETDVTFHHPNVPRDSKYWEHMLYRLKM